MGLNIPSNVAMDRRSKINDHAAVQPFEALPKDFSL
jgi:hypothetical protein